MLRKEVGVKRDGWLKQLIKNKVLNRTVVKEKTCLKPMCHYFSTVFCC